MQRVILSIHAKLKALLSEIENDYYNSKHDSYRFHLKEYNRILSELHSHGLHRNITAILEVPDHEKGNYLAIASGGVLGLFAKNKQYELSNSEIDKHGEIKYNVKLLLTLLEVDLSQISSPDEKYNLKRLFKRFHGVAIEFKKRYGSRKPFVIKDEYDVQDLIRALLFLFYDDVHKEEPTPSVAGSECFIDYIIKSEKIGIEIKSTSGESYQKLTDRKLTTKIRNELIVDIKTYESHEDVEELYCFVYDPNHRISNKLRFEEDLSKIEENYKVFVYVYPKKS